MSSGSRRGGNVYREPGSAAADLFERARRVLPGGNTRTTVYSAPYPPYAARGRGAVIVDADGEERLDFVNNYTALIHGHADPDINEAVIRQLADGVAFAMPTEHEIALAELLTERVPSLQQVRFTNSGTEAVMMAIKAARAYTGRPRIAKFDGCYHGSYDFAEVSTQSSGKPGEDGFPVATPYTGGTPQAVLDSVVVLPFNDIDGTERLIEQHRDELAAVLIDPNPRSLGLYPAEPAFLQRLREITRAYGIVLIFDEVISLRSDYGGMQSVLGVTPDLTAMGKIIGGGFPVGAVGGSAEVMSVFDPTGGPPRAPHGGTFNANPVTMVAGLTAMRKLTPAEFDRLATLGQQLRAGVEEVLREAGVPGQVTGYGSLFHIHLHQRPLADYRNSVLSAQERAFVGRVHEALMGRGIFITPALFGCLSTPMGVPEVEAFVDAFAAALQDARGLEHHHHHH
nr:Chain A, Aminotransferase class-III [Sphaerobacter thermophilus DSM 20745]6K8H_B Chain B, Aminotransferase class-III [Sphaerobacter thermophilus DSM 20745]